MTSELRGPVSDDICYATTNRQDALKAIAEESDLVRVVGLTAGASAPSRPVDAVIATLAEFGPATVGERELTRETTHFTLPAAVRH